MIRFLVVGGDDLKVGDPTVAGATVEASVVKEGRAKKGYRLQVQEKNRISQKERTQTGFHTG